MTTFTEEELIELNELFLGQEFAVYIEKINQKIERIHNIKLHDFRVDEDEYLMKRDIIVEENYKSFIKSFNEVNNGLLILTENRLKILGHIPQ